MKSNLQIGELMQKLKSCHFEFPVFYHVLHHGYLSTLHCITWSCQTGLFVRLSF